VDDLADAVLHLFNTYDAELIVNIGWGEDVSIRELAELIVSVIDYRGQLTFDTSKQDGTPRKLLDVGRLHSLGWRPRIPLRAGIEQTYRWFREHIRDARL
jgi:GDP-L-fucose synthase